jgi:beta-glucosidase
MKKTSAASTPIYKNPAVSVPRRVQDLLSRMTLEEKAAQMIGVWQKKSETLRLTR